MQALADALRAQTHEAANRLHVIAGLVELGRTEEAIALAGSEADTAQDLLGRLGEGIEEPCSSRCCWGRRRPPASAASPCT